MTISIASFPGCCTANVISGFGGSRTQNFHQGLTTQEMKKGMADAALTWGEMYRQGFTIATLTTEQTTAINLLTELGWQRDPTNYPKPKHPETDLVIFTIQCQAFLTWAQAFRTEQEAAARAAEEERRRNAPPPRQVNAPAVDGEGFSEDFEEEDF